MVALASNTLTAVQCDQASFTMASDLKAKQNKQKKKINNNMSKQNEHYLVFGIAHNIDLDCFVRLRNAHCSLIIEKIQIRIRLIAQTRHEIQLPSTRILCWFSVRNVDVKLTWPYTLSTCIKVSTHSNNIMTT